ncbi:MAG: T9SS C-terminal target domain-containing protein [Ignavibacteriae bacterium]|nr:T9SS C-terminal target domain-containing protein [Ignavibacteriota bacterium]
MRKIFSVALFVALLAVSQAVAQPTVILGPGLGAGRTVYHQTGNRTLDADTTYILTGLYFVDSTYSLTIEPGTIIRGDTAATLIIGRGATINANATSSNPIVFTSLKPIGFRAPGDWGGLVILGNAPSNQVNPLIEGGIIPGSYGGSNPNDNSGTFRYVRIEYPGYRFQLNNEVNGLTMGGVGRGTTIEYVQVSYSFDDSFEWFGGTVNARYLVAFGGTDDEFDTDFGYQGFGQFLFGLKDPAYWDPTGETNGFETDNEGSASYKVPRTMPRFSNVTLVGAKRVDSVSMFSGNKFQYSAVVRRGTMFSFYNSAILGYPGGLSLRDSITFRSALNDSLQIRTSSIAAYDGTTYPVIHASGAAGFFTLTALQSWFNNAAYNNLGGSAARTASAIGLVDLNNLNNPDPRPGVSTELATAGTEFSVPRGWAGTNFSFDSTTYRGAFNPALGMNAQWTSGWTNFDPQNTHYMNTGWNLVSVPRVPASFDATSLFPTRALSDVWAFSSGYTSATTLSNGPGYWAYYSAPKANPISGGVIATPLTLATTTGAGWVLIGCKSTPVSTSALSVTGAGVGSDYYGFTGSGYSAVTTLEPGRAYWVYVTGATTISIP